MYRISKSVYLDFAHHVVDHPGACSSIHGHTWEFEIEVGSKELGRAGFVLDFKVLRQAVLSPVHDLLDHSFVTSRGVFDEIEPHLVAMGKVIACGRSDRDRLELQLDLWCGASLTWCGGMKVVVMPFNPTSERLAEWFFRFARYRLELGNYNEVEVRWAEVTECLHPVKVAAKYGS